MLGGFAEAVLGLQRESAVLGRFGERERARSRVSCTCTKRISPACRRRINCAW